MCRGPKKLKQEQKRAPVPAECPPPKPLTEKSKRPTAEKGESSKTFKCEDMVVFYPYGENDVYADFKIHNMFKDRYAFKLKSSNEKIFTCKPSCGFVTNNETKTLCAKFAGGPIPKDGHYFKLLYVKAKDTVKDSQKYWDKLKEGDAVVKRIPIHFLREMPPISRSALEVRTGSIEVKQSLKSLNDNTGPSSKSTKSSKSSKSSKSGEEKQEEATVKDTVSLNEKLEDTTGKDTVSLNDKLEDTTEEASTVSQSTITLSCQDDVTIGRDSGTGTGGLLTETETDKTTNEGEKE